MRLDELHLWYLGDPELPRPVGALRLVAAGKGVSLRYDRRWLASGFPLSEDLPLRDLEHLPPGRLAAEAPRAVGAVDDARPDRWGEKVIRFVDQPARLSLMEFLYYAGDDRFGALGVSTSATDYRPRPGGPLPRLGQVQQLGDAVAKIAASEPIDAHEAAIVRAGGSLGGAKPKALIEIDGEPWVLKFYNGEPIDVPRVEHATLALAGRAGITVARTQVLRLAEVHALAVRRFDRQEGRRLHAISAGTAIRATAAPGEEPELGYPALARILRRIGVSDPARRNDDARELFRRIVFNILIDNTDDHEKNHALLVVNPAANGRVALAPAYDVLPTNSGQGCQEFVCGRHGREATLDNALSEAEAFGLQPAEAAQEVAAVIAVVDTWQAHFAQAGVGERDIASLAECIDGDALRSQRRAFDPERYRRVEAPRRRRTGPFRR